MSVVDILCGGTMPTHKGDQTQRATHHFSLFNPLRRVQKRADKEAVERERGAGGEGGGDILCFFCAVSNGASGYILYL